MSLLATLWWMAFFAALGLCAGSFLNVVIYRLPRNLSLRDPIWSMCPHCGSRIRWYDNLPIVSYLVLGGRCRDCHRTISQRYLVVEALTAIVVLAIVDAFFVAHTRGGLLQSQFGLTDKLAVDWPILLAHLVLFTSLLSMSAIDIEHYWVDIRFTHFATIVGFAAHTIWTPRHSMEWIRPWDSTAIGSIFALGGLGLTWVILVCQPRVDPEDFDENDVDGPEESLTVASDSPGFPTASEAAMLTGPAAEIGVAPPVANPRTLWKTVTIPWGGWLFIAALTVLLTLMSLAELGFGTAANDWRLLGVMFLLFLLVARLGMTPRESDQHIVEAIHEERFGARRMVLEELALLLPAIAGGIIGLWLMSRGGTFTEDAARSLHSTLHLSDFGLFRHWQPLYGLATAASGFVVAGAIGWAVRIGFTLLFGREAFGSGDIHMMAAAGCVAGWPVVALGLFLTCVLALGGWILALPLKRSRAIPLGPWLSLAFLIVVVFYDQLLRWPFLERAISNVNYLLFNNSQAPFS